MDKNTGMLEYSLLKSYKNIFAFTTTKQTFDDPAPRFTGDKEEEYIHNRSILSNVLKIPTVRLIFPRQTHSNRTVEISEIPSNELQATDALITNKKGFCICVQTADCVPILLYDPKNVVVAVVHAGWRGTVRKIVDVTVKKMIQKYHSIPTELRAIIGPSIGPEVYEVGTEVVVEVKKNIPNADITLHKNRLNKYHLNLWEANRQLLLKIGLNFNHIQISSECSFTNSDNYFSARREGIHTGRMVTGIMLLENDHGSPV